MNTTSPTSRRCALLLASLSLCLSAASWADCNYTIINNWGSGFTGEIKVTNNTNQTVNGWSVSWKDSATITNAWNANLSGSNPYTATALSWNGTLAPNASASFGFQGTDNASVATVSGSLCGAAASSSSKSSTPAISSAAPSSTTKSSIAPSSIAPSSNAASSSSAANNSSFVVQEEHAGFCSVDGSIDNNNSGFTGDGFANTDNAQGKAVKWAINATNSTRYTLSFRFANGGSGNRNGSLLINGGSNGNFTFELPTTGSWTSWKTASIEVDLVQGNNLVQLSALTGEGLPNIDSLTITGQQTSGGICGTSASSTPTSSSASSTSSSGYVVPANAIHVATSGSDNGNGSALNPFRTIAKAAQTAKAGDTILVSGGTYSEKQITPGNSGLEGKYIVFRAKPGSGTVTIKHPATTTDTTPVFNLSNRNYIWIEGFQFKDFSHGLASVYISSGQGNVIVNNRFENLGNGTVAEWNGNQIVGIFNGTRNVVCNNYFNNIYGDGVALNSQNSQRNLVCNNTFTAFKGKLRSWGGSYLYSRGIDVQDMSDGNNLIAFNHAENVVHHIWLDRDASNNIILRNVGNQGTGNVFNESRCKNNVIQENIAVGMTNGYMTSYYTSTGWTEDARWINNLAYNNKTGFNIHKSKRDEFRNNIAYNNTDYNIRFSDAALKNGPHIFRNNLWYSSAKTNSIYLGGIPQATESGGATYAGSTTSVANFQSTVGESGGHSVDPRFVSSADFTLQSNSPAKKAGDNGLDLGAYAIYPKRATGWNASNSSADVIAYFDQAISSVTRGNQIQLSIRLNKAANQDVRVNILPVAGDTVSPVDFNLSSSSVTFSAGETSKTISVSTSGISAHDELVAFRLESAVDASTGGRNLHVLRIKN
jgi:hypothetical protein